MSDGTDWLARLRRPPKAGTNLAIQPPAPASSAGAAPLPAGDTAEATRLIEELRAAVRRAGILRDDPMMPLMSAFARAIQFMAERGSTSDRVVASASERINGALVEARRTADAEAERFSAKVLATETDIIRRIAGSIAASADEALTRRVQVFDRNTALLAAAVLVGVAFACLGGGYLWGGNDARADIHETEAGLRAAFSDNAADANNWMLLMDWNDLGHALSTCGNANRAILDHGRHACLVPLWTERPQAAKLEQ